MDFLSEHSTTLKPNPKYFESFLKWACENNYMQADLIFTKVVQDTYVNVAISKQKSLIKQKNKLKASKLMSVHRLPTDVDSDGDMQSLSLEEADLIYETVIKIETVYDSSKNMVKIRFLKNKAIPRTIIQVIGLTIPYHKYLTSITINSGLRMDTLYEISKILPDSNVTELCFDNTFLTQANYHVVLTHSKLQHLSLARCSINDAVVKTITDQLEGASPASKALSALNLSANRITDVGAKYIADMLRTNRQLSYLNLAGNRITDEGGMSILDTLQNFPLESKECSESRARYVAYLKKKNESVEKITRELLKTAKEDKIVKKRKTTRKSRPESQILITSSEVRIIQQKAENMADTEMGLFIDPFSPNNTLSQEGVVRCLGNNTLCYLNLAYNNLTYLTVKKLLEVLLTQKSLNRTPRGLIKVVIEGNLMPVTCKEYEEIDRLFAYVAPSLRPRIASKIKSVKIGARE